MNHMVVTKIGVNMYTYLCLSVGNKNWYSPPGKGKISSHLHVGEGGGIISEVKGNSQINFGRVRLELKPPNRHSGNDGTFSNTLLTDIYLFPLKDIENLKRSLHYAKHVLQADYENKLQERALDL